MTSIILMPLLEAVRQHILRVVGDVIHCFVANLTDFQQWKNFENRLRFDEIVVPIGWRFFETQCRYQRPITAVYHADRQHMAIGNNLYSDRSINDVGLHAVTVVTAAAVTTVSMFVYRCRSEFFKFAYCLLSLCNF